MATKNVVKLAEKIVREMNLIDAGISDGKKLRKLTRRYITAQKKIDRLPA